MGAINRYLSITVTWEKFSFASCCAVATPPTPPPTMTILGSDMVSRSLRETDHDDKQKERAEKRSADVLVSQSWRSKHQVNITSRAGLFDYSPNVHQQPGLISL